MLLFRGLGAEAVFPMMYRHPEQQIPALRCGMQFKNETKLYTNGALCSKEGLIKSPNIPSAAEAALQVNHLRHG